MCRFTCPVVAGTADETATPTAMMQTWGLAKEGKLGWDVAADALQRCTGCEACRDPCEFDQDVPAMLYEARAEAWEQGAIPEGAKRVHDVFLRSGNPFGADLDAELQTYAEPRDFDRKGRVLYWPGCRELSERPERVAAVMALFRALGADHVTLPARDDVPDCCGAPLLAIGDAAGSMVAAAALHQYFDRQRTWVTASGSCLTTVLKAWPGMGQEVHSEVLHLAEFLLFFRDQLADLGREAMEISQPALPTLIVHDACSLHRRTARGAAVYEVLEAATGIRPEPFGPDAQRTGCCGAGDFHDLTRPEAAAEVARWSTRDRRYPVRARVVTGDIGCVGSLRRAIPRRVPVQDLVSFLTEWLAPVLSG
jgi:Fe-S oxidoreductase